MYNHVWIYKVQCQPLYDNGCIMAHKTQRDLPRTHSRVLCWTYLCKGFMQRFWAVFIQTNAFYGGENWHGRTSNTFNRHSVCYNEQPHFSPSHLSCWAFNWPDRIVRGAHGWLTPLCVLVQYHSSAPSHLSPVNTTKSPLLITKPKKQEFRLPSVCNQV